MGLYLNGKLVGISLPQAGGGQPINNQDITVTENGTYEAEEGYTGLGEVTVNVPGSDIVNAKNATDASIESGSKVWLEKKAGGGTRNFTTSGSYTLNDDNGIIVFSNSAGSIGKTYSKVFDTPLEYIEVQAKVQASGSYSFNDSVQTGLTQFFTGNNPIRITANNNATYGGLRYSIDNLSSGTLISGSAFRPNKWYWVKIRITNTKIEFYWSEDGQIWNKHSYVYSGSGILSRFADQSTYFGVQSQAHSYASTVYIGGMVDLTETYVKADDTYWWRPYLDTQVGWNIIPYSFSSANSFTGTATQSVASSATGDVKTVLPEQIGVDLYVDVENAEISVA